MNHLRNPTNLDVVKATCSTGKLKCANRLMKFLNASVGTHAQKTASAPMTAMLIAPARNPI